MLNRQKMRDVIRNKGIKQKVLAQKAGLTESQLSSILSGRRKCDVEEYVKLCEFLEVPFATFMNNECSKKMGTSDQHRRRCENR